MVTCLIFLDYYNTLIDDMTVSRGERVFDVYCFPFFGKPFMTQVPTIGKQIKPMRQSSQGLVKL